MKVDYEKLKSGLSALTGLDYERAEREERGSGNTEMVLATTPSFMIRLAAIALDKPAPAIKELPLREYMKVYAMVLSFLNSISTEASASLESTDK